MRILFLSPYSPRSVTGVGRFVQSLVSQLGEEGGESVVIAPREDWPQGWANVMLAVASMRAVFRYRRVIDAVHCQAVHLQTLAAGLIARALGKGVVLTIHGPLPVPSGLRGVVARALTWATPRVPHAVVLVAGFLKESFPRGAVIPNGVPAELIRGRWNERDAFRLSLGLSHAYVVVYVGRVTEDKGVAVLLDAWRRLAHEDDNMALILVGPPSRLIDRLAPSYGPSQVRFEGPQTDPWQYLAAADLFVLPSFREGLPLGLLEAMAMGLPVVASRVGGVPEVVEDRRTGILVDPGDAEGLRRSIEWAIRHPGDAAEMGRRAAGVVSERFSLQGMSEAYRAVYAQVKR